MKQVKNIIVYILVTVGVLAVIGIVLGAAENNSPSVSPQAEYNTMRSAFISGCAEDESDESYCSCAWNELTYLYDDFATNMERVDRILTVGYNDTEIDAMLKCLDTNSI